jgi:predicted dehydrogenase
MTSFRGGLIGCGFFAINHLHAWREIAGADIVALCDRDPERLRTVGDAFGIARRYADAEAMLAEEALDFVDIATTVDSHRALVERAAAARVPAICQKPFATSMRDARAMVEACERAGIALMVHENFRWQRPIQAVRAVIEEGAIGEVFWARASFRSAFDVFSGQPYLATQERFIIEDLGIHVLDIARFLLGEATRLTARTQRINPSIRGEDVATILLEHRSGATSIVDCSYATRLANDPFPETLLEIDGSRGSIRLGQDYRMTVVTDRGTTLSDVTPHLRSWAQRPWFNIQDSVHAIQAHWIEQLRTGGEPQTSGRDNLRTLELVSAAYRSAESGATVALGDD